LLGRELKTFGLEVFFSDYRRLVWLNNNDISFSKIYINYEVNKIKLLLENKDLCKKIGENARRKVKKEFDWKVIGEQWLRLINSLLK
jgi:glycosyltransferase involved in cell wall biosynthesis